MISFYKCKIFFLFEEGGSGDTWSKGKLSTFAGVVSTVYAALYIMCGGVLGLLRDVGGRRFFVYAGVGTMSVGCSGGIW